MMACEGNFELVSAFMDGEMDENERLDAAEHIKSCPACQKLLEEFTLMGDMIREDEVSAPEGFSDSVMEQIIFRQTKKNTGKVKRYGYLVAACVLLVIAGITQFAGDKDKNVAPAADNGIMYSMQSGSADDGSVAKAGDMDAGADAPALTTPGANDIYDSAPTDDSFPTDGAPLYDGFNGAADSDSTESSSLFSNDAYIAAEKGLATQNFLVYDLSAAEKAAAQGEDDYIIIEDEEGQALIVSAEVFNSTVYATSNLVSGDPADDGWVMLREQ